jgi:hypothetical protein
MVHLRRHHASWNPFHALACSASYSGPGIGIIHWAHARTSETPTWYKKAGSDLPALIPTVHAT